MCEPTLLRESASCRSGSVGIDVSKDYLDVALGDSDDVARFANIEHGIAELVGRRRIHCAVYRLSALAPDSAS